MTSETTHEIMIKEVGLPIYLQNRVLDILRDIDARDRAYYRSIKHAVDDFKRGDSAHNFNQIEKNLLDFIVSQDRIINKTGDLLSRLTCFFDEKYLF